jgi:hypothetical protein
MRKKISLGFFLILLNGIIVAQNLTLPQLTSFKRTTSVPVIRGENLRNYIAGPADAYLSLGFVDLQVAEYKKGKSVIKLEIYRHSDNATAFGIYSLERSPSLRYINIGAQGYVGDGVINFFKGNYYVKIRANSKNEKVLQSAESLAVKVSAILKGETKMPAVLSQFPETGKKINEEIFINENVLGHKFLNKAFKANYESGSDTFSIYLMESSSPEESMKSVESFLTSAGMDLPGAGSGRYMLKDGNNGTIFLAWKDNTIVIISGLSTDQSDIADRYTSEILK